MVSLEMLLKVTVSSFRLWFHEHNPIVVGELTLGPGPQISGQLRCRTCGLKDRGTTEVLSGIWGPAGRLALEYARIGRYRFYPRLFNPRNPQLGSSPLRPDHFLQLERELGPYMESLLVAAGRHERYGAFDEH